MKIGDLVINRETGQAGIVIHYSPSSTSPPFIQVLTADGIEWIVGPGVGSQDSQWQVIDEAR